MITNYSRAQTVLTAWQCTKASKFVYLRVTNNFKMTIRSTIFSLTIITFIMAAHIACTQTTKNNTVNKTPTEQNNKLQIDTSKTAIIPFDKKGNYPFNNSFQPASITPNDINNIDSLLIKCVTDYNTSLKKDYSQSRIALTGVSICP